MGPRRPWVQNALVMSTDSRAHPKPKRRRHFIREWRRIRDWTLAEMAAQIAEQTGLEISEGQLSRIETGNSPYTQDTLEAIALTLGIQPSALLANPPGIALIEDTAIGGALETLSDTQRKLAMRMIGLIQEFEPIFGEESVEKSVGTIFDREGRTHSADVGDLLEEQRDRQPKEPKPKRRRAG